MIILGSPSPEAQHIPIWKLKKTNWQDFQAALVEWVRGNDTHNMDLLEDCLVRGINQALSLTIPTTSGTTMIRYNKAGYICATSCLPGK